MRRIDPVRHRFLAMARLLGHLEKCRRCNSHRKRISSSDRSKFLVIVNDQLGLSHRERMLANRRLAAYFRMEVLGWFDSAIVLLDRFAKTVSSMVIRLSVYYNAKLEIENVQQGSWLQYILAWLCGLFWCSA